MNTDIALQFASTSVRVNGLFIPAKQLGSRLSGFCQPLYFASEEAGQHVTIRGTMLRVSQRGRLFGVATQHQIKGMDYKSACLIVDDSSLVTSEAFTWLTKKDGTGEEHDIAIFEFPKEPFTGVDLTNRFLSGDGFEKIPPSHLGKDWQYFAIGYASEDCNYEVDENGVPISISCKFREFDLELSEREQLDLPNRIPMTISKTSLSDLDGISGSPVFAIMEDQRGNWKLEWAGIITDASKGKRVNIIPASMMQEAMDEM